MFCLNGKAQYSVNISASNTVKQIKVKDAEFTMDVSDLAEGVYNISLSGSTGIVNKKVVIVK